MQNVYAVNNPSFLKPLKNKTDYLSPNQVDTIDVAVNMWYNKNLKFDNIYALKTHCANLVNTKLDDDLYIKDVFVDEYDNDLYNIIVRIESANHAELYDLFRSFADNNTYLIFDNDNLFLSNEDSLNKTILKGYPNALEISDDMYMVKTNFFSPPLMARKQNGMVHLELKSRFLNLIIQQNIDKKFNGEHYISAPTIEEVLETFYSKMVGGVKQLSFDDQAKYNELEDRIKRKRQLIADQQKLLDELIAEQSLLK